MDHSIINKPELHELSKRPKKKQKCNIPFKVKENSKMIKFL